METYISLVGIVIAFCTLIFLMMRGVNLFITVMIASLIAIVSGNMNIYETLTENYMTDRKLLAFNDDKKCKKGRGGIHVQG